MAARAAHSKLPLQRRGASTPFDTWRSDSSQGLDRERLFQHPLDGRETWARNLPVLWGVAGSLVGRLAGRRVLLRDRNSGPLWWVWLADWGLSYSLVVSPTRAQPVRGLAEGEEPAMCGDVRR